MKIFAHGSMRSYPPSKLHLSDEEGTVFCGVTSFWFQQYDEIPESGNVHANYHIGNIEDMEYLCKRCRAKYLKIRGDKTSDNK